MPAWLLNLALPAALNLISKYAIPALEAEWPELSPIINDVIKTLGGDVPTPTLQASASHFNIIKQVSDTDTMKSSVSPKNEMASMP